MNTKEKLLSAKLLKDAAIEYATHGCNDWEFPPDWTEEEKVKLMKEYHDWNGDPHEFSSKLLYLPDYAVMSFLAHKLNQSSGDTIELPHA